MIPSTLPSLSITRGDDETFSLLFQLSDGSPYDLSVWKEIRAQVRMDNNYTGRLLATMTTTDSSIVVDINRLTLKFNSVKTINFVDASKKYYLDIRFVDNDDNIKTLLAREVNLRLNITEKA